MNYKVEKDWIHEGLRCVVIAGEMGHRCGYVGVPSSHPLFRVEYNALAPAMAKALLSPIGKRGIMDLLFGISTQRVSLLFDVHGSLTFSGGKGHYPVESDLWWFGFDCAHVGDGKDVSLMSAKYRAMYEEYGGNFPGDVIRTLDYCIAECESLARQLKELEV